MSVEEQAAWLEQSVGVRPLEDRTIVEVSGDDAATWLQGQLTNQMDGLAKGESVYGFILSLKGRVMVDAWVLARDDDFWLDVPAANVPALLERLDRYIIMEDVDLAHRDDLAVVAVQGPRADELTTEGWSSDRLGLGGRVLIVPKRDPGLVERTVAQAVALGGGEIDDEAWHHAHVVHGRPRFGVDFSDDTYPQETGLTATAVSFNKGCYIGQETVVMLENRGKAPKTLWRWSVDATEAPAPGTDIVKNDAKVGSVTSSARTGDGIAALGFLKRGHEPEPADSWRIGDAPAAPECPVGDRSA